MESVVVSQIPATGTATSSALSLLLEHQNQMSVVTSADLPCFGASSPRRAFNGGMWHLDVPYLVLLTA
jgi:hypothetical protein